MQGDLHTTFDLEDAEVVDLPHGGNAQRGRLHALAQTRNLLDRLDVDDDVALGHGAMHRRLHGVGRGVPLADRCTRRDPDHDVREVAPRRLPQPQPA